MSKQTDTEENTVLQNVTVTGNVEINGNLYSDVIESNTDNLPVKINDPIELPLQTVTTASSAGNIKIYTDTDGFLKSKDSTNVTTIYNPITTKGDLITSDGTTMGVRLGIGNNNQYLTVDTASSTGLLWKNEFNQTDNIITNYSTATTAIGTSYTDLQVEQYRNFSTSGGLDRLTNTTIFITKPGTYLVIGTYTLTKTVGTTATTCTIKMVEDTTGGGFTDVPGASTNTFHQNTTVAADTGSIMYIKNYAKGDLIKGQAIKSIGTGDTITQQFLGSNLSLVNFNVDYNDNSQYVNIYKTSNTVLSGSYQDISLQATRIMNSNYTFSNPNITVGTTGTYLVGYSFNFQKTSGVDASEATFRLMRNGTFVSGTEVLGFVLNATNNLGTTSGYTLLSCTAGDTIKVQGIISGGTNLTCISANLLMVKVQSNTGQANTKYAMLKPTTGVLLGTSTTDLPFPTEDILTTPTFSHTVSNELTINENGYYYLFTTLTGVNSNASAGTMRMIFLYNSSSFYNQFEGTNSESYVHSTGASNQSTITNNIFVYLGAGLKIKVQALRTSTSGVITTVPASCNLLAIKANVENPLFEPERPFGSYCKFITSDYSSSNATQTFSQKCLLLTGNIPAGFYRIDYAFKNASAVLTRTLQVQITVNNSVFATADSICTLATEAPVISSYKIISLKKGNYNIQMDFRNSTSANAVIIREASILFYRVN